MSQRGLWPRDSLIERALAKVVVQPSGCWHWTGNRNDQGYGLILPNGSNRPVRVHRVTYEHFVAPIPEGLTLDHLCHSHDSTCPGGACEHRRCVNPSHLEPVTRGENVVRGVGGPTATCIRGHARTPENTYYRPGGKRECRECGRIRNANAYRRYCEARRVAQLARRNTAA